MSKVDVHFTITTTLISEFSSEGARDKHCKSELKVHPDAIADKYLDGGNEPNEAGCVAYVVTSVAGLALMIHFMRARGFLADEDLVQLVIDTLNDRMKDEGEVHWRKPPPGGLLG
jgi:hypothetical protein